MKYYFSCLAFGLICFGCATVEVYQMSRQTVMEEEAQGEWPEFEKKILPKTIKKQANFLRQDGESKKKDRVLSVLNGEFISQ